MAAITAGSPFPSQKVVLRVSSQILTFISGIALTVAVDITVGSLLLLVP